MDTDNSRLMQLVRTLFGFYYEQDPDLGRAPYHKKMLLFQALNSSITGRCPLCLRDSDSNCQKNDNDYLYSKRCQFCNIYSLTFVFDQMPSLDLLRRVDKQFYTTVVLPWRKHNPNRTSATFCIPLHRTHGASLQDLMSWYYYWYERSDIFRDLAARVLQCTWLKAYRERLTQRIPLQYGLTPQIWNLIYSFLNQKMPGKSRTYWSNAWITRQELNLEPFDYRHRLRTILHGMKTNPNPNLKGQTKYQIKTWYPWIYIQKFDINDQLIDPFSDDIDQY